jgi:pyruvate/2-oxoglutarate dehydrogenase complex dihydrolipoamide acyltransferase (E2) component
LLIDVSGLSKAGRTIGKGSNTHNFDSKGPKIMATEILLPKIGFSMNEGQLNEWLAEDGAQVTEGQPLFTLESDKSTNEVEAPASGTLKITAAVGEVYEVGTVLGTIE